MLCLVWQDLGTTQIMTIVHSVQDIEKSEYISHQKRRGIPTNSTVTTLDGSEVLPIPLPIREYNKHMGGSDANAQCRSYYSADTRSVRYWWPLFQLLLDASVLNAFNIWKLLYPNSTLSHVDFQHTIALNFTQNPLAMGRKFASRLKIEGSNPMIQPPTHHFIQIDKKAYCHACRARAKLKKKARTALAPIDRNQLLKRTRPPQTTWGCAGCPGRACCHLVECFRELHRGIN